MKISHTKTLSLSLAHEDLDTPVTPQRARGAAAVMMTQSKLALLLAACTAMIACDQPLEDEQSFEDIDESSELLEEFGDSDGFEETGVIAPEQLDNSAPCGEQTLAIAHAPSGATYVFCAVGDDQIGVLEELPADGSASSLLEDYPTAGELLRAVAPSDVALRDAAVEVVEAVERGHFDAQQGPAAPIQLGAVTPPPMGQSYYCSTPSEFGYSHGWSASFVPFIEEFVADWAQCEHHLWYTGGTPSSVTSHQRTASAYQVYADYGSPYASACAGKEHVLSCGGSTLFRALRKETPNSSWTESLNYWVSSGSVATWKMYASNCQSFSDKDDMRYTGSSESGAYHYYRTIFIKWIDGGFCSYI